MALHKLLQKHVTSAVKLLTKRLIHDTTNGKTKTEMAARKERKDEYHIE